MKTMIYLVLIFIAGFVCRTMYKGINTENLDYKIAIAKDKIVWMGTDDYKLHEKQMNQLYDKVEIEIDLDFESVYWIKPAEVK